MVENLMSNPYAWAFLAVCTVGSTVWGIFTWVKSRSRKEFSYFYTSYSIVRDGKKLDPAIKFTFNGIELDNLTSTRFAIWNSGNQVINYADIVKERDLEVVTANGAEILSAEIVGESEETNKFRLSKMTAESQHLMFDYADKHEGVVLQLFHTGYKDDLSLTCKIKGGKQVKNAKPSISMIMQSKLGAFDPLKVSAVLLCVTSAIITILAILVSLSINNPEIYEKLYSPNARGSTSHIVMAIIYWILAICYDSHSIKAAKRAFQLSVPHKLRKFM